MPTIRPSTDSDIPAITAIYQHHVLHGTGTFEIDPPSETDMAGRRADVLAKIDEYQALAGELSTDLAADGGADPAQPKLERLMVLAEDITPAFIARHPNCKAYLEASLRIRGQWATLDPEAIVTPGLFVQRVVPVPRTVTAAGGFKA